MSVRTNRSHHRPNVRRLPHGLGPLRWATSCNECGWYRTVTFWRAAMAKANAHAEVLR